MRPFTHREYFVRYQLNVAQYGEILVAQAFGGKKLGDSQPCYDIATSKMNLETALLSNAGNDVAPMIVSDSTNEIRIQVRSKRNATFGGRASVVHCKTTDLDGRLSKAGCQHLGMTHLAVVLVDPGSRIPGGDRGREGLILQAWLVTRDQAAHLRKRKGKVQYIRVNQLTNDLIDSGGFDITRLLLSTADAPIHTI